MQSRAIISRSRTRGGLLVRVSGTIDETFDADEFLSGAVGVMVIDLDGVARITSFGIRSWMAALDRLQVEYFCLINCTAQIVAQLNMVTGFTRHGEVISFHAPYFCASCEIVTSIVLDLRRADHRQAVATMNLPTPACPQCGDLCEFDDIPEIYLQYFRSAPMPNPPSLASALIDGREVGQSFCIEKQVTDAVTGLWMWGVMDRPQYFRRLADGLQGDVVLILNDVENATERAFKAFLKFLRTADASMHLARAPGHLLASMAKKPDKLGQARIISVMLPYYCEYCRRTVDLEVPARVLADVNGFSGFAGYCSECGKRAQPRIPGALLEAGHKLPVATAPAAVVDYLAERSTGPTPDAETWDDETMENPLSRYRIEKYLGSGGMGDVYRARYVGPAGFEKIVVIKRIRQDRLADLNSVRMFLQEARLSARLSHPNLVQIFDFGQMDGSYFLTMEYVDGADLRSILNLCRKLYVGIPIELALRVVSDLCQGLHSAHQHKNQAGELQPIIHRDVTPANVLISSSGVVKLTDFGIAKLHDAESPGDQPEQLKGTPRFVAPELLTNPNFSTASPTVDVYGIGVLLFEVLTGRPLFEGDNWADTLSAILQQPVPSLAKNRIGISPHLERTFQRAVQRNPNKRYQDMRALQQHIDRAIDELKRPASSQHLADWLQKVLARRGEVAQQGELDTMNDLSHDQTGVLDVEAAVDSIDDA